MRLKARMKKQTKGDRIFNIDAGSGTATQDVNFKSNNQLIFSNRNIAING